MKNSGVEWLGAVPAHWGVVHGTSILTECRKKNDNLASENYLSLMANRGIIPYAEKGDVGNKKPDDLTKCKIVEVGDYVVNSMNFAIGSYGVSAYNGIVSPVYVVMKHNPNRVDPKFVNLILSSASYQNYAQSFGTGILDHRRAIGWDEIKVIKVPLPPLEEQSEIAAWVATETARIDALIAKKTRFIELLVEKRQSLITHAITKGLNPKAPMKDSGIEWLGKVPAHWTLPKLRYMARIQTGTAVGKDMRGKRTISVPYLRVANVQDGYLDLSDVQEIQLPAEELQRYLLRKGDVLMNEGGDNDKLGRGHIWNGEVETCVHQNHVFAVRPYGVTSRWLNIYTGATPAQYFFLSRSKQTTNLASISSTSLMGMPVPRPPKDEQETIVSYLGCQTVRIDALVAKTERSIELLREHRTALITAAVTGKIDLRNAA